MRPLAFAVAVLGLTTVLCVQAACTPESPPPTPPPAGEDGGHTDAGVDEDAGLDGGSLDEDAGADGGTDTDAGEDSDAGHGMDAGEDDGGTQDAGCPPGAGAPPNLLPNASFECGTEGWIPSPGTTLTTDDTIAFEGVHSARLSSANGGVFMGLFPSQPPASEVGARRFCAEAFVQAAAGTNARLTIRSTTGAGGARDESFTAPMDGTWQRLHVRQATVALDDQVTVRIGMPEAPAGAVLHVDDVALWESPDGGCARAD